MGSLPKLKEGENGFRFVVGSSEFGERKFFSFRAEGRR